MTSPKGPLIHLSIRIPTEDYDALVIMAREGERNLTQETRRAIKAHINKHRQLRSLGKQSGPNTP